MRGWVDVFTRNEYKDILVDNLKFCQENKGLEIFAWPRDLGVTNHVHLIFRTKGGHSLPDILRDYKKFTSKEIKKAISENYRESRKEWLLEHFKTQEGFRFWRGDNKPIELWSNKDVNE